MYQRRVNPEGGKIKPDGLKETTMRTTIGRKRKKMMVNVINRKVSPPVSILRMLFKLLIS
jgi:hypothetical protein